MNDSAFVKTVQRILFFVIEFVEEVSYDDNSAKDSR